MDALFLSRLQFAAATMFHFLFVPLTLGLSLLIAIFETRYVRTGDEAWLRATKFWGKLFLINFVIGVVTGITLEFQFGTNWSRYSTYVGDIFGSLLAIEATAAFFLESTFIGVWVFGWKKLSPKAHAVVAWLVFFGSNLSAVWILIANGFMQNPLGYVLRNGRAELSDFAAVVFNPFAWQEFLHTVSGSYLLACMFVLGISSWHLLRKSNTAIFKKCVAVAAPLGLAMALVVAVQGHFHGNEVARTQPTKLAAMESHWHTEQGAPMYLIQYPDEANETNVIQALKIPDLLSILAYNDPNATVKGLLDFPKEDRPPVLITFLSFRIMVGLGTLFILLMGAAFLWRKDIENRPWLLKALLLSIPLPFVALEAGWVLAEVGRQPWIVYGLMRTSDAFSPVVAPGQIWFSLIAMCVLYTVLGLAGYFLMFKYAAKGPEAPTHA
ncbi:cytochrome bd ubiquinol oxidase subunit I [Desulfovibrio sp. X2]|uniref:cytochrome ubiquinol oxidase subunit I n=1 Tax=Desulfovibrio sp. X2 TaxID=941449 RepID=UPI000358906A|nr:cytochrome ubiquinol oxidase subunit I [Desulfovibrio sp. X2]EPR44720.1 cytochrome bd ubiquinol oxidase subunit I [Desulfovibrio sp. X2]